MFKNLILLFCWFSFGFAHAEEFKFIKPQKILLGYEATFQNKPMTEEPQDEDIFSTPEKLAAGRSFLEAFGARKIRDMTHLDFKPYWAFEDPKGRSFKLDMEPQCVEVIQNPKTFDKIKGAWDPIYKAAQDANLEATVYQNGYRSGSGHFHVGAIKKGDRVFVQNPLLLRNLIVLMHQNPSLLYGFASAFELGSAGQDAFPFGDLYDFDKQLTTALEKFDQWYKSQSTKDNESIFRGLVRFLSLDVSELFEHNVFLNLEHLDSEKGTIEFRNIRPLKSSAAVESMAYLILKMLDYSAADRLLPLVPQSHDVKFNLSPQRLEENWREIKAILRLKNLQHVQMLDELIFDLTRSPQLEANVYRGRRVRTAFDRNGRHFLEIAKKATASEIKNHNPKDKPSIVWKKNVVPARWSTDHNGALWKIAVIPSSRAPKYQNIWFCEGLF